MIDLSAEMRRICEMIEEEMQDYQHHRRTDISTDITTVQEDDLKSSLGAQYVLPPPPSPLSCAGALALPPPPVVDQILLSTISGLEGRTHANVRKVETRVATPEGECGERHHRLLQLRAKCSFYEDELSGECCFAHIC
jgi:hypothetical protein